MRTPHLIVAALALLAPVGAAHAQSEDAHAVADAPSPRLYIGVSLLPMLVGRVVAGAHGNDASSSIDPTYGVCLSADYRIFAGLSAGVAPQIVFGLNSKDPDGYSVIESEREYDFMARIAYTYRVVPKLDVYAEFLPGFSIVTYSRITVGSYPPSAKGLVFAGGVGAAYEVTDLIFANLGIGYQQGFQKSSGIIDTDVKTKFLRIAVGGGVRF